MSAKSGTERFIDAALSGDFATANEILESDVDLLRRDPFAAACYGAPWGLTGNEAFGRLRGGPRDWPILLYLCYSEFQRFGTSREEEFAQSMRLLLETGADPNSFWTPEEAPDSRQTALFGVCGRAENPALTKLLLDAGADPNEGSSGLGPEALYHAAELPGLACLRMLLEAGPDAAKVSYCLGRKLDFDDFEGVRLFLDYGADPNFVTPFGDHMTRLHHAIQRGRDTATIALLLDRGGDLALRTAHGKTPYALAVRYGRRDVAALLRDRGAKDGELSERDRFVGACALGDDEAVLSLRADPASALAEDDYQVLAKLAEENKAGAVSLMIRMGFDPNRAVGMGPALHHAAWTGAARTVDAILAHKPDLEVRNGYGGTALGTAVFAATHCHDFHGGMTAVGRPRDVRHGDYPGIVASLLAAGARAETAGEFPTGVPGIDALLAPHLR